MPSLTDIVPPFDPTTYTQITGAQLLQLVSGLVPYTDKGMIITTTDDVFGMPVVPDASTNTKWQKYLWLRQSMNTTGLYIWCSTRSPNANIGVNLLQWYPLGIFTIPAGSIVGEQIATGTIMDLNISDVDWSKITNVPAFVPATGSITAQMIQDGAVTASKLSAGGLAGYVPKIAADGVALQFFKQNVITQLADPNATLAGLPVAVNASGTGFTVANAWGVAGATTQITHHEEHSSVGVLNTNNRITPVSAPDTTKGVIIPELSLGSLPGYTFVPQADSYFVININLQVSCDIAGTMIYAALFDNSAICLAVAAASVPAVGNIVSLKLSHVIHNTDINVKSYSVYFGPASTAGTPRAYLNENSTGQHFGSLLTSFSSLTEYA